MGTQRKQARRLQLHFSQGLVVLESVVFGHDQMCKFHLVKDEYHLVSTGGKRRTPREDIAWTPAGRLHAAGWPRRVHHWSPVDAVAIEEVEEDPGAVSVSYQNQGPKFLVASLLAIIVGGLLASDVLARCRGRRAFFGRWREREHRLQLLHRHSE